LLPSDLDVSLAPWLPGWTLVLSPIAHPSSAYAERRWAIIAASAGAVLAVALIGIAIAWDIRREYALVELRDRFVANVSHELKTPLSLIRMYAETLYLRRLTDPDRQHQYHSMILHESEHLSRMIGDVLDFARLRQGLPLYRLTETDLLATVASVVHQYRPEWQVRGASIDAQLASELSPVAHDPRGIAQILLNLVDNAIKYGGAGKPVQIRLQGDQDWVDLQVIDAGPGLDPVARRQLRQSMQRGRIAEAAGGSGLGLALVEQIAGAHRAHFILAGADGATGLKAVVSFPVYKGTA
jgi:signal transduction histidine kinase